MVATFTSLFSNCPSWTEAKTTIRRSIVLTLLLLFCYHNFFLVTSSISAVANPTTSVHSPRDLRLQPVLDDFVWYEPKPKEARILGWEDDWMVNFKQTHYDPNKTVELRVAHNGSPYKDYLLSVFPGYIPARMPLPPESQNVPRVIFLSWKTRRVGPNIFLSIKTLLNHNPEYELIFMDDYEVDQFVCELYPDMAPDFGKLRAGAARADVWRMLVIYRYGGVYLDIDMSSLTHMPIPANASGVSGVGHWGHLPGNGGVLEHWIMVFEPRHKLINKTLELLKLNLKYTNNTFVTGKKFMDAEKSETIRLTGPAVYQRALRALLRKSQCQTTEVYFTKLFQNPEKWCNITAFRREFGNFVASDLDLGHSVRMKMFNFYGEAYWNPYYDAADNKFLIEAQEHFCDELASRAAKVEEEWQKAVARKQN